MSSEKLFSPSLKSWGVPHLIVSALRQLPNKVQISSTTFEIINSVLVRFFILVMGFAATTFITRALSVEDRGKYAILINLVNLLMTFFTLGFHTSIVYRLSKNKLTFSYLYIIAFSISLLSAFVIAIASFLGEANSLFSELSHLDFYVLALGGPIVLFSYFNSFFFLGINNFKNYNIFELVKASIFLVLTSACFAIFSNYQLFVLLFIFSNLVHSLASFIFFLKHKNLHLHKLHLKNNLLKLISIFKKSFGYSMISYVSCSLAMLLSRYSLFFIGSFLEMDSSGAKMLGLYSVALANMDTISILPSTLAFFIFPKISLAESIKSKIKITNQMIGVCILFFIIIGILSFTIAHFLFGLLYGPIYHASVPMFQLLLPSGLFLSIISCISSFIGGIGNQKTMIYAPLSGLLFMIISSLFLIRFEFDVYYFIYAQNMAYFIYLLLYVRFYSIKWKEI